MNRRVLRRIFLVAAVGTAAGLLTPLAAQAAVVCGQTITASMTLGADLTCPGNGIFINASNVTLDLGGKTVSGPTPAGDFIRGVSVNPGRTGVKVQNGTIRGFDFAVNVSAGANGATLTGLTLDANGLGIATQTGSSGAQITGNTISDTIQFSAVQLGGNAHLVERNVMTNGATAGVFLSGNENVIRANGIVDMGASAVSVGAFPSNPGPFVNNQIVGNSVSGSSRVFTSSSISVVNGFSTLIGSNSVTGRGTTPGVFINNSANTVATGNSLSNNSSGVLVRGASSGTQLSGNAAWDNSFSGLAVESAPSSTLISGNAATSNGVNGIDVRSPSTTLAANAALFNGNLGIFAVSGVSDAGGNKAFGNGNPAQCSANISC